MAITMVQPRDALSVWGTDEFYAIGEASQNLKRYFDDYWKEVAISEFGRKRTVLEEARTKIKELGKLREGWDSYGAPIPNQASIQNALRVIGLLEAEGVPPTEILPSAEGGIGICFLRNNRYADIECSNEGDFLGVYYVGQEMPRLLEIDGSNESIAAALLYIRNHIRA